MHLFIINENKNKDVSEFSVQNKGKVYSWTFKKSPTQSLGDFQTRHRRTNHECACIPDSVENFINPESVENETGQGKPLVARQMVQRLLSYFFQHSSKSLKRAAATLWNL